jgi:hypothetical protein
MTGTTASDTATTTAQPTNSSVFANGVKLVGETFIPGASLMLDGKLGNGAAHAVAGLGARIVLGPIGLVLVAADSYSKSVSGKYLWDHLGSLFDKARDEVHKIAPETSAAAHDKPPHAKT